MMFEMEKCLGRNGTCTPQAPSQEGLFAGGETVQGEGAEDAALASVVAAASHDIGDILDDELGAGHGADLANLGAELGLLAGLTDPRAKHHLPTLLKLAMASELKKCSSSGSSSSSSSWSNARARRPPRPTRVARRRPIAKGKEVSRRRSAAARRAACMRVRRVEVVSDASDVGADSDSDEQWTELDDHSNAGSGSGSSDSTSETSSKSSDTGNHYRIDAEPPQLRQFLLPLISNVPNSIQFRIRHDDILQLLATEEDEQSGPDLPALSEGLDEPYELSADDLYEFEEPPVSPEEEASLLHYVCGGERGSMATFQPTEEWMLGVFHSWCEVSALIYTLIGTDSSAHRVCGPWAYRVRLGCHCRLCICSARAEPALACLLRDLVWTLAHGGSTVPTAAYIMRALRLSGDVPLSPQEWDLPRLKRIRFSDEGAAIIHSQLVRYSQQNETARQVITRVCSCREFDKPFDKQYAVERLFRILECFKAASNVRFKVDMIPLNDDPETNEWLDNSRAKLERYLEPYQDSHTAARIHSMVTRTKPTSLGLWEGYQHSCECTSPKLLCAQQRKQLLRSIYTRMTDFGLKHSPSECDDTELPIGPTPITFSKPKKPFHPGTTCGDLQQGDGTGAKPPDAVTTDHCAGNCEAAELASEQSDAAGDMDDSSFLTVSDSDCNSGNGSLVLSNCSLDSASELVLCAADAAHSPTELAPTQLCRTVRHLMRSIASIEKHMDTVLKQCNEWPSQGSDGEARKQVDQGLSEVDRKLMAIYRRLPEVHRRQLQVYKKQKKLSTVCMQLVGGMAPAPPPPGSPPPTPKHLPCRALCPEYHLQRFKEVRRKVMHMRDQQLYYHRLKMWLEDQLKQERESIPECNLWLIEEISRRRRRGSSPRPTRLSAATKRKLKPTTISKPHKILQLLKHKAQTSQLLRHLKKESTEVPPPAAFTLEREENVSDCDTIVGEKVDMNEVFATLAQMAVSPDKRMQQAFAELEREYAATKPFTDSEIEAMYPEAVSPPLQEMSPTTEPTPVYPNPRLISKFTDKDSPSPDLNAPLSARTPVENTGSPGSYKDPNIYKYVTFGLEIKKAMEECQNIINSYNIKPEKDLISDDDSPLSLEQICEVMMSLDKNSAEFLNKVDDDNIDVNAANSKLAELVENMPQILANMPEIASEFANASFELPEFASIMNSLPESNETQLTPETLKQIRDLKLSKNRDNVKVTKNTAKRKICRKIKNHFDSEIIGTMTFEFDNRDINQLLKDEKELQALIRKTHNREDYKELLFSISAQVVVNKVFEFLKSNNGAEIAKCMMEELFALPKNSINAKIYSKASILFEQSVKDSLSMNELKSSIKAKFDVWKDFIGAEFKSIPLGLLDDEIEVMYDKFYAYIQDIANRQTQSDRDKIIDKLDCRKEQECYDSDKDNSNDSLKQIAKIFSVSGGSTFDLLLMKMSRMAGEKRAVLKNMRFKYVDVLRRCSESQQLVTWILSDPELAANHITELMGFAMTNRRKTPDSTTMPIEKKREYFMERLKYINKEFMDHMPKKTLNSNEWLVMLYRLEQFEKRIMEALVKFSPQAPQRISQNASEAEILAAKGLSKIIGKANNARVVKKEAPNTASVSSTPKTASVTSASIPATNNSSALPSTPVSTAAFTIPVSTLEFTVTESIPTTPAPTINPASVDTSASTVTSLLTESSASEVKTVSSASKITLASAVFPASSTTAIPLGNEIAACSALASLAISHAPIENLASTISFASESISSPTVSSASKTNCASTILPLCNTAESCDVLPSIISRAANGTSESVSQTKTTCESSVLSTASPATRTSSTSTPSSSIAPASTAIPASTETTASSTSSPSVSAPPSEEKPVKTDETPESEREIILRCETVIAAKGNKTLKDSFNAIKAYLSGDDETQPPNYQEHVMAIVTNLDFSPYLDDKIKAMLHYSGVSIAQPVTTNPETKAILPDINPEELAKYSAQAIRNVRQRLNAVAFKNLTRNQSKSESDITSCDVPSSECKYTRDCICTACKRDRSICVAAEHTVKISSLDNNEIKVEYGKKEDKKKEVKDKKALVKGKPMPKQCENASHQQHVCKVGHTNGNGSCTGDGDQHCTCCYCTVFGHAPPLTTPVPRNFNETRERLRSILNKKKQLFKTANGDQKPVDKGSPQPEKRPPIVQTQAAPVEPPQPRPPALPKTLPPNLTAHALAKRQALENQKRMLPDKMAKMVLTETPDNKPFALQRTTPVQVNVAPGLKAEGKVNPNAMEQIRLQQLKQQQAQYQQEMAQQKKPEPIYDLPIHNKPPQQQQQIRMELQKQQLQMQQQPPKVKQNPAAQAMSQNLLEQATQEIQQNIAQRTKELQEQKLQIEQLLSPKNNQNHVAQAKASPQSHNPIQQATQQIQQNVAQQPSQQRTVQPPPQQKIIPPPQVQQKIIPPPQVQQKIIPSPQVQQKIIPPPQAQQKIIPPPQAQQKIPPPKVQQKTAQPIQQKPAQPVQQKPTQVPQALKPIPQTAQRQAVPVQQKTAPIQHRTVPLTQQQLLQKPPIQQAPRKPPPQELQQKLAQKQQPLQQKTTQTQTPVQQPQQLTQQQFQQQQLQRQQQLQQQQRQSRQQNSASLSSRDTSVFSTSSGCSDGSCWQSRAEDTRDLDALLQYIEGPTRHVDRGKKKAKKQRQKAKKTEERLTEECAQLKTELSRARFEAEALRVSHYSAKRRAEETRKALQALLAQSATTKNRKKQNKLNPVQKQQTQMMAEKVGELTALMNTTAKELQAAESQVNECAHRLRMCEKEITDARDLQGKKPPPATNEELQRYQIELMKQQKEHGTLPAIFLEKQKQIEQQQIKQQLSMERQQQILYQLRVDEAKLQKYRQNEAIAKADRVNGVSGCSDRGSSSSSAGSVSSTGALRGASSPASSSSDVTVSHADPLAQLVASNRHIIIAKHIEEDEIPPTPKPVTKPKSEPPRKQTQTWEQALAHISQVAKGTKDKKKPKQPAAPVKADPKPVETKPAPAQPAEPLTKKQRKRLAQQQAEEDERLQKELLQKESKNIKKKKKKDSAPAPTPMPVEPLTKKADKKLEQAKKEDEAKTKKEAKRERRLEKKAAEAKEEKKTKENEVNNKENKPDKNVQAKQTAPAQPQMTKKERKRAQQLLQQETTKEKPQVNTPHHAEVSKKNTNSVDTDKPASCSIMEQLSCGIQVSELRLPPGITLTRVQPNEKKEAPAIKSVPLWKAHQLPATPTPVARPQPVINADPSMMVFHAAHPEPPKPIIVAEPPPVPAAKSKKSKKKGKKAAASAEPPPSAKMVTLRNPMFHPNLPPVQISNSPPVVNQKKPEQIRLPEPIPMPPTACQATITPAANGMYTIRNPLMSMMHQQQAMTRPTPANYYPPNQGYEQPANYIDQPSSDYQNRIMNLASFTQKNDEGYSLFKTSDNTQKSFLSPEYYNEENPKPVVSPNPIGTRPERADVNRDMNRTDLNRGDAINRADITRIDMNHIDMSRIDLNRDMTRIDMNQIDMSRIDLNRDMNQVDMSRIDLNRDMNQVDMSRIDLNRDMTRIDMNQIDISRIDLNRDMNRNDINRSNMNRSDINRGDINTNNISRSDLNRCDITINRSDLNRSELNTNRSDLNRSDTLIDRSDLNRSDLSINRSDLNRSDLNLNRNDLNRSFDDSLFSNIPRPEPIGTPLKREDDSLSVNNQYTGLYTPFGVENPNLFRNALFDNTNVKEEHLTNGDLPYFQRLRVGSKLNNEVTIHHVTESKFYRQEGGVPAEEASLADSLFSGAAHGWPPAADAARAQVRTPHAPEPRFGPVGARPPADNEPSFFLPDSIPNLSSLEACEREMESFKRYEWYFTPRDHNPKVQLHVSNIANSTNSNK